MGLQGQLVDTEDHRSGRPSQSGEVSSVGQKIVKDATVDSHYYVDRLLRYIGYYVENSKHQTISYINLYK